MQDDTAAAPGRSLRVLFPAATAGTAAADSGKPGALSLAAAAAAANSAGGGVKSPSKASPVRPAAAPAAAAASADAAAQHDDVLHDSLRTHDQKRPAAGSAGAAPAAPTAVAPAGAAVRSSSEQPSKYMQLLSTTCTAHGDAAAAPAAKAPRPGPGSSSAPAAQPQPQPPKQQQPQPAAGGSTGSAALPPLRASASPKGAGSLGSSSGGAKAGSTASGHGPSSGSSSSSTTPLARAPRPRASILDASPGPSLIPASPGAGAPAAVASSSNGDSPETKHARAGSGQGSPGSPTKAGKLRVSCGAAAAGPKEPASPIRRSVPTAQHRAHYAFGSRIDASAGAAPAVARRAGASGSAPAEAAAERASRSRVAASPQRMPAGARALAAAPSAQCLRSASAPRMSSAEKAQSRLMQHSANAAAAARSKTPNPAARSAAAAAGSSPAGGGKPRGSPGVSAAESRHIARMRASDMAGAARGTGTAGLALRSPTKSPGGPQAAVRGASRSLQSLGAGAAGGVRPGALGGRAIPTAPAGQPQRGPRAERLSAAAAAAAAARQPGGSIGASACSAGFAMLPTLQHRYRDLYKHTTAQAAVAEALAAGAAGRGVRATPAAAAGCSLPAGVPKLALSSLLRKSADGHAPAQVQAPAQASAPSSSSGAGSGGASILGASAKPVPASSKGAEAAAAGAAAAPAPEPQQRRRPGTPQEQEPSLLPLYAVTPPRARGARAEQLASPCTPAAAAASGAATPYSDISFTPPAIEAGRDATPSLQRQVAHARDGADDRAAAWRQQQEQQQQSGSPGSPPLLPRSLSCDDDSGALPSEARGAASRQASRELPLAREGSRRLSLEAAAAASCSTLGAEGSHGGAEAAASLATAAKGLVLPLQRLDSAAGSPFESPPKHRRGERSSSPRGAAQVCSELLKHKASNACGAAAAPAPAPAAAAPAPVPAALAKPGSAGKSAGARRSRPGSAGSSPAAAGRHRPAQHFLRKSTGGLPSIAADAAAAAAAAVQPATPTGSSRLAAPPASPGAQLRTPVPRLDLTPVLSTLKAEQDEAAAAAAPSSTGSEQSQLVLHTQPRRLDMDGLSGGSPSAQDDAELQQDTRLEREPGKPSPAHAAGARAKPDSAGKAGRPGSGKAPPGSGAKKRAGGGAAPAASSGARGRASAGREAQGSSASSAQQQESFYVYEPVVPQDEQQTYEGLRRVLAKAPGGKRHVNSLAALWGCYQDARRNTEAMAFRGHRLLDQVSNEFKAYKQDSEEHILQLTEERDAAREDAQLALVAASAPGSALDLAQKDQELQAMREENCLLRSQLAEMEKALAMASEFHSAQQEQQVPAHARVIAGSATTNILTSLTLEQQARLQDSEKRLQDMKAALLIACGVLRHTNYMDEQGAVRASLAPDTLQVLDMMVASTQLEGLAEAQQHSAPPDVHIEELSGHAGAAHGAC